MTTEALSYINDTLEELSIPYEYETWTAPLAFPYCVGEYTEISNSGESGYEEATFMITATTTGPAAELESIKETIKNAFPPDGKTGLLQSGSGIAVTYETALPIPLDDQGVRRLQVNLNVKEWRC